MAKNALEQEKNIFYDAEFKAKFPYFFFRQS